LARISRINMLKNSVIKLRTEVRTDTVELRNQAIASLQELFLLAKNQAQNPNFKSKERQDWLRIAAYTCQVINSIATRLDESQIDKDLNSLEELINEVQSKSKAQSSKTNVL
jgi:hypothetical protein